MPNKFSARGGASVGWINVSWPLAELSATAEQLRLSVYSIGRYTFTPDQIVRLETCGSIPILHRGIRLLHARPDYTRKIIFWCFQSPERLIDEIRRVGFVPTAPAATIPQRSGIAVRWTFLFTAILLWNLLFILDGFVPWSDTPPRFPGFSVFLALALVFCAAVVIPKSSMLQSFVLKPGRSVTEIQHILSLLGFVSGMMLAVLVLILLIGKLFD